MFNRIFALIIKEILAVWRDKKSRAILIVPPIVQLLIFANAATLDVKNISIAYLNQDSGKTSFELIQRFKGSPFFTKWFALDHVKQIQEVIDTQQAIMVLHIQENFSRDLEAALPAQVQLIFDGRRSNSAQIVGGYSAQILDQFSREFAQQNMLPIQPSALVTRNWYNPNLIYKWFTVPCLVGIITMLIGNIVTALSVARERELGTFDQLLVSPLQPIEILLGKTIPAIIIGMAEGTIILFAALNFFDIPFEGSLLTLYACMFVFICSIIGVGLFVSSISSTQQQAILGTFVFMAPAVILSGFATPIENMPQWLQYVTYANPLRYFLIIIKGIFLKDIPPEVILANVWPMALIAVILLTIATKFFRSRVG